MKSFEPARDVESHGLCSHQSLITLNVHGMGFIPVENYQGLPIKLKKGMQLGVVRPCDSEKMVDISENDTLGESRCATKLYQILPSAFSSYYSPLS